MGSNTSIYASNPTVSIWKKIFDLIGISERDVSQLYSEFSSLPVDQYLTIEVGQFINTIGLEDTSFTHRVFNAVDSRHANNINFGEYVTVLWNFCTLGKGDLAIFAFDLYDDDCNGEVSPSEVTKIINDLYGDNTSQVPEMQSLAHKLTHMPGAFNVTSFNEYCQKHPAIVTPILATQEKVRRIIMGEGFWKRLTKSREQSLSVMTLSKLRILLLQYNDNRRRQTVKGFIVEATLRVIRTFSNKQIHSEVSQKDVPSPTNVESAVISCLDNCDETKT